MGKWKDVGLDYVERSDCEALQDLLIILECFNT
jgi:hypothetical protein